MVNSKIFCIFVFHLSKEKNLSGKVLGQITNNKYLNKTLKQKIIKAKGKPFVFEFQGRKIEIKEIKWKK